MKDSLEKYICKIEGHGYLKISYDHANVQLVVDEGERLFEKLILGRHYKDAPFITARICGVCPTAHTLASIAAIENAFGAEINRQIELLRKVILAGQIIQSHALHFFFLASPDYLKNIDDAIEISKKKPEVFKIAMSIKDLGDEIVRTIGGRQIHPVTPTIGGFLHNFKKEDLKKLRKKVEHNMHFAVETLDLALSFKYPDYTKQTEYFALTKEAEYALLEGKITSSKGVNTDIENYSLNIRERTVNHSSAKHATHEGESFMVGALARMNLQGENLNNKAKNMLKSHAFSLPNHNPYHINIAQAAEILHLMEQIIRDLDEILHSEDLKLKVPYKVKSSKGTGAIEAPRGTLYHYYEIDDEGIIRDCDIVTPTVQNLKSMEDGAQHILKQTKNKSQKQRYELLEMLIRAYDPCITCSVH